MHVNAKLIVEGFNVLFYYILINATLSTLLLKEILKNRIKTKRA